MKKAKKKWNKGGSLIDGSEKEKKVCQKRR